MKYLKIIIDHLKRTCVYFTVSQLLVTAVYQISAQYDTKEGKFILFETEMILLLFSVVMALIQDVFKIKKLSFGVKLTIHFILTMTALFVLMLIIRGNQIRSIVVLLALAAVIYAIGAAVVIIIRIARKKREDQDKAYTPMFKEKKK